MSYFPTIAAMLVVLAGNMATQKDREAFFRCKDAQGLTRYGDSLPAECVGVDTEVLNSRGTTVRLIEGSKTREQRLANEVQQAREREERESRANRDHMLMDT